MRKSVSLLAIVCGILILLTVLFLCLGHLRHEREEELARLIGEDEQTKIIRAEADQYRLANKRQQIGIAAAGFAVVLAAAAWQIRQCNCAD